MTMSSGNVFGPVPEPLTEEHTEMLAGAGSVRIERIVSRGHASPSGFWYDQDHEEWVMILGGAARLMFEGAEEPVDLVPGDWLDIPAHKRHRVEWTDPDRETVWLAVHYQRGERANGEAMQ